jgi:hypothetical protein
LRSLIKNEYHGAQQSLLIVDLRILQDPSLLFDRGDMSINVKIMWEARC